MVCTAICTVDFQNPAFAEDKIEEIQVDGISQATSEDDNVFLLYFRKKVIASISCYHQGANRHVVSIGKKEFDFKKGPFCRRAVLNIQEKTQNNEIVLVKVETVESFFADYNVVNSIE